MITTKIVDYQTGETVVRLTPSAPPIALDPIERARADALWSARRLRWLARRRRYGGRS